MRGSSLEDVVQAPVIETQSWEEEFWKVTWACSLLARSVNLLECLLARKRKSGPSRWVESVKMSHRDIAQHDIYLGNNH